MTNTRTVPDISPGYPSKGKTLGPAWAAMWTELTKAKRRKDPYLDGHELAALVAPEFELAPATLVAVISRAAQAGLLAKDPRAVTSTRGKRTRTFYAIPKAVDEDA